MNNFGVTAKEATKALILMVRNLKCSYCKKELIDGVSCNGCGSKSFE